MHTKFWLENIVERDLLGNRCRWEDELMVICCEDLNWIVMAMYRPMVGFCVDGDYSRRYLYR